VKPISLQLYTVRTLTKDDPLAVLQKIADIGYAGVEGHGFGMSNREFRRVVEDMGMRVSSYFGPFPNAENVQEFIDAAGDLGTEYTVSGFWIPDFESRDAIRKSADKVNAVLPALHQAGLSFALHNHWFEFWKIDGKLAIEWLLESAPDVDLELDIYWASAHGQNRSEQMVERFRERVPLLHVKDGPMVEGKPMTAVGSGAVDVRACIEAADPNKLAWLIVELDEYAGDMMEAVESSYRYLTGQGLGQGKK
jgi:sugar phosphate isomerase/epimerase